LRDRHLDVAGDAPRGPGSGDYQVVAAGDHLGFIGAPASGGELDRTDAKWRGKVGVVLELGHRVVNCGPRQVKRPFVLLRMPQGRHL